MLARAKSNIGQDDGGFSYDLHQAELQEHRGVIASYVVWGDEMAGSAREMLATAEMADDEGGALSDTSEWLKEILTEEGGQLDKQNVMLLAREHGLDTCPQAAWLDLHHVVRAQLAIPASLTMVCGMALGYRDPAAPINEYQPPRESAAAFTTWHGTAP